MALCQDHCQNAAVTLTSPVYLVTISLAQAAEPVRAMENGAAIPQFAMVRTLHLTCTRTLLLFVH